jgi:glycosyltransferase involved in cell wall biosynthesis
VDLNVEEDRTRDGVVCGDTVEDVVSRIRDGRDARPVEFLGWLPVFKRFGNCGAHPQFTHTHAPPTGYKFVRTGRVVFDEDEEQPPRTFPERVGAAVWAVGLSLWMFATTARRYGVRRTFRTLCQFARFMVTLVRRTRRVGPAVRFAHSRNFQSQVLAPPRADLAFVTSVPYTYGQNPWVIEVEDPITLFYPFILNGHTAGLDVRRSPYFAAVKALLEADNCRGIVTHMRSTAELLPALFQSEVVARKVTYAPLGVPLPARWQQHDDEDGTVNLLFTNSWHQFSRGFFLRGGLDVLEAFDVLRRRYPQVRLTLRTRMPRLDDRYHRIVESGWVRVIDRFLPAKGMAELQRESHIYLLPAARIHIVSVLEAMSFGQAVVVSDGWGMGEYIEHGRNGLLVPGRHGKVSWADREAGMLRENYGPMYARDAKVVEGLIESVSLLVEDAAVRRRLGRAARADVETRYNPHQWNAALKAAFDKARSAG